METAAKAICCEGSLCSYPTYEEWKPGLHAKNHIVINGSYPTYEEWKL